MRRAMDEDTESPTTRLREKRGVYLPFFAGSAAFDLAVPRNCEHVRDKRQHPRLNHDAHLLRTVLALLPQLARGLLDLGRETLLYADVNNERLRTSLVGDVRGQGGTWAQSASGTPHRRR